MANACDKSILKMTKETKFVSFFLFENTWKFPIKRIQ